ncbi:MAG: FAD-dependent oxidoreductase [Nitriliruptorales bacterium]|nr:FAD-dependent oxidoreductase [Nitriliruptorales bacterium]
MSRIERYDALVVGAGPNGLSAAITLARWGRSVLVLEAAERPGGAVITEELTLPGFRHDVFSSVYPAAVASPVLARMPLERHGLRWVHPPVAMAHPMPDGRAAALYLGLERTVESLERLAPGDGRAWEAFMSPYVRHFEALRRMMLGGFPPVGGGVRLLATLGLDGVLEFARMLLMSADALAGELFRGEHATAWLYGSTLHGDVPPQESGSAITGMYMNVMGHAVGWPSPAGGADGLSGALVGYLHALGGKLRTSSRVDRIVTVGNRVAGAVLAGGDRVRANIVVCDVGPRDLLRLAGDALPERYRARMARFRYGPPTFKLDWALSGPVPWEAAEAREAGTVHVGGPAREISDSLAQVRAGEVPERPFLLFGQQSLADPTRAPARKHTAWAYTHPPPGLDWSGEKDKQIERVEAQVERFAPGFRDRILARNVLTPGDMQSRNPNLIAGDVGGGSYTLDQVVFRPLPGLAPYRTPLRGLYIGSASAFPGGAVHGVPGHAAARLALAESLLT